MTENKNIQTRNTTSNIKKHVIVFDHARVDPSHCLADGLFRPLKRQTINGLSLDARYKYKGYTFRWLNHHPLNITDQSVFLAVHRLASKKERVNPVRPKTHNEIEKAARDALKLELQASDLDILVVETTLYEIRKILGVTDSGANLKNIKESLLRLSSVKFFICADDDESSAFWKANLIGYTEGANGKIMISINPWLCKALAGNQYTFVSMQEQRALRNEASKRLHLWLSSWIKNGKSGKIALDLLIPHVWGDECEKDKLRKRREYLRKSLNEINALEKWACKEDKASKLITITRKNL